MGEIAQILLDEVGERFELAEPHTPVLEPTELAFYPLAFRVSSV